MNMPRIMIVSNLYPPNVVGGAELVAAHLATWLAEHDRPVSVVTTCTEGDDTEQIDESVRVIRYLPFNLWWNLESFESGDKCSRIERAIWNISDVLNTDSARQFGDIKSAPMTHAAVRDALRCAGAMFPAGWLTSRRAYRNDYLVLSGTEIYIPMYIIQRYPERWEQPDHFHPERFAVPRPDRHPLAMLPFSAGPRNYNGEHLARLAMQLHLFTEILQLRYVADRLLT
jgi:cytochrome P450